MEDGLSKVCQGRLSRLATLPTAWFDTEGSLDERRRFDSGESSYGGQEPLRRRLSSPSSALLDVLARRGRTSRRTGILARPEGRPT